MRTVLDYPNSNNNKSTNSGDENEYASEYNIIKCETDRERLSDRTLVTLGKGVSIRYFCFIKIFENEIKLLIALKWKMFLEFVINFLCAKLKLSKYLLKTSYHPDPDMLLLFRV